MVVCIIDTYAWIEYFLGSKKGEVLRKLLKSKENKFITMECCLSEVRGYSLKNNVTFAKLYSVIKANSFIFPVLRETWIEAAKVRFEERKRIKDFGLIDSLLVAKQKEMKCKIISGDKHFENMENVIYIGSH